jgi:hypothetical protein
MPPVNHQIGMMIEHDGAATTKQERDKQGGNSSSAVTDVSHTCWMSKREIGGGSKRRIGMQVSVRAGVLEDQEGMLRRGPIWRLFGRAQSLEDTTLCDAEQTRGRAL